MHVRRMLGLVLETEVWCDASIALIF